MLAYSIAMTDKLQFCKTKIIATVGRAGCGTGHQPFQPQRVDRIRSELYSAREERARKLLEHMQDRFWDQVNGFYAA
jgi:hypothetical protein